jgi:hypothetical protein
MEPVPSDLRGSYQAPPWPTDEKGETRRVGLEIEIASLPLEHTRFGKFKVELDSMPLRERAYLRPLEMLGMDPDSAVAQVVENSVLEVARGIVPLEVVSPPIPWNQLHELDSLWARLREAGASDTRSSLLYAFGLHLNPVIPNRDVGMILAVMRSFLLLEDWIMVDEDVDLTRRIAPYIRPFPESYRRKLLDPSYDPDFASFVTDYVTDNPTRNRPLDLLPLLAHLGANGLESRVEDWALVGARPTFHYRLPNCDLAQPAWTPAADWNRWVMVERLASKPTLLHELSVAYLDTLDLPLRLQSGGWTDQVRTRLYELGRVGVAAAED